MQLWEGAGVCAGQPPGGHHAATDTALWDFCGRECSFVWPISKERSPGLHLRTLPLSARC